MNWVLNHVLKNSLNLLPRLGMRFNKNLWLLTQVLLSSAISLCAQKANYINYNESNGLPSNEAYTVFQDHDGFIWMSTDNGAVRFDGQEFMLFNKQNGMADNVNFGIYSDSKHRLWFRSYSGAISIYDNGQVKHHTLNKIIQKHMGKSLMLTMAVDAQDRAYLPMTAGVLMEIDSMNNYKIDTIPRASLVIKSTDGADPILLHSYSVTEVEQLIFDGVSLPNVNYNKPLRSGLAGVQTFRGKTYFFMDSYLYEIDKSGYFQILEVERPIISLSCDAEKMWIGLQSGGLYSYDGKRFQRPGHFMNLNSLSITSVLRDTNGCYWISTLEKGVFYFPNLAIVTYPFPSNSKVGAVSFGNDAAYFGNYDGSLYSFSPSQGKFELIDQLESSIISLAYVKKEKNLFVSAASATYLLPAEGNKRRIDVRNSSIWGLKKFQERTNDIVGANSNRFLFFNKNGNLLSFKESPLKTLSFLIENETVFVAPVSGLIKTNLNFSPIDTLPELVNNKVLDLKSTQNRILVATAESGLLEWKDNAFKPYFSPDVFSCSLVRMIHTVGKKLYLATECGLVIHHLTNDMGAKPVEIYNAGNGLLNTSTNYVGFVDKELLCFSSEGISVIDTASLMPKTNVKFYLKNSLVNNKQVSVAGPHTSEENNIEFNYGFISFNNRDIRVKHRPSSKLPWTEGNLSKVNYYSLSPGYYEPELSYSVQGGEWQLVKLSPPFRINPPLWETTYFRILVVVVLIIIIGLAFYSIYQKRVADLKYHHGIRLEKNRISQELHDNIGSKLAYVKFSLSSLNNVHDFQDKKGQIEGEISSAVDELRDTIWAINKEEVHVLDFVDRVRLMLSRISLQGRLIEFTFVNNTAQQTSNMDPGVAVELFRIIQEAVNNSIKHSGGSKIIVELSLQSRNDLFVTIKDNGVGFDQSSQFGKDGYGLRSMKRRAEKLGAEFKLNSSSGEGTAISVIYRLSA